MHDPIGILTSLVRCMADDASIFISVPNLDSLPLTGDLSYCLNSRAHVLAYTADCMTGLLADAGLQRTASVVVEDAAHKKWGGIPVRLQSLAGKTNGAVTRPRMPLAAAERALARYRRRYGHGASAWAPVRWRAALHEAARRCRTRHPRR